jgi:hypothetical protein
MQFNDLLREGGVDPKSVVVFRHRPKERKLRKVLSWLVDENHELFNANQQTQGKVVERAMLRAKFVASFIGHEAGPIMKPGNELAGGTAECVAGFTTARSHALVVRVA